MATVAVTKATDYKEENVHKALMQTIDSLGGIKKFVNRGDKVLLKPNFLSAQPPEKAVTTHPAFIKVDKGSNYVFQVIILLMAMFTIFNTILMSALERKREFAGVAIDAYWSGGGQIVRLSEYIRNNASKNQLIRNLLTHIQAAVRVQKPQN